MVHLILERENFVWERKLFIIIELVNYESEKGRAIFIKRKSNHR